MLTTSDVARLYEVSPSTIRRWADQGLIPTVLTPSGQLRYPAAAIHEQLAAAVRHPARAAVAT